MQCKKPIVSIITATYNVENELARTIKSIRELDYKNYEWIIIDGKSTDNTISIIKKNSDIIKYWVSEKDNGIYDAWNKGICKAEGEWIIFLGAGDYYKRDSLNIYIDAINSSLYKPNFISSKVELINNNGKLVRIIGEPYNNKKMRNYMNIAHIGSFHHHSLFKINGFFKIEYKVCSDYEFFLRSSSSINSLFIDSVTAGMVLGGVSGTYKGIWEAYRIQSLYDDSISPSILVVIAFIKKFLRQIFYGY